MRKRSIIVIAVFACVLWGVNLYFALYADTYHSNLWGDAFGMVNSLFSFFTVTGVLYSIYLQRKEQDNHRIDNFENTFFKMLNQLQNITNTSVVTMNHPEGHAMKAFEITAIRGNEYYSIVFNELLSELRTDRHPSIGRVLKELETNELITELLNAIPLGKKECWLANKIVRISRYFQSELLVEEAAVNITSEEIRTYVEIIYTNFLRKHTDNIDHFYRYLNSLLKFIERETAKLQITPIFYYKLVQAQLTNAQLGLLFYSSITSVAKNANGEFEFAKMLDASGLLENIPKTYCPNKKLAEFYPNTKFKFLS